jgi:hypothetical protein
MVSSSSDMSIFGVSKLAIVKFFLRHSWWNAHQQAGSALSTFADEAMKMQYKRRYLYSHSEKGFREKVARSVSTHTNRQGQLPPHQPDTSQIIARSLARRSPNHETHT